ncbi:MAG TPA: hypothetical protein DCX03_00585 [Bacteroidales bacterium]|nr:hypothetical protein [Bacteroidales bacterium]
MANFFALLQIKDSTLRYEIVKIFFIVVFCLITLSALLAWSNPAIGYEISIYSNTPQLFWVFTYSVMLTSFGFIYFVLYHNRTELSVYLKLCLVAAYLCYILINALFIIRGYYAWNMTGDGASHLGWTKDLISAGHIPEHLFYPLLHIFLAELTKVTQLDLVTLHKIVPVILGALFVPFMFVFARSIFPKEHIGPYLVALISCCFIVPCTLLAPNMNSNLIFPLLLTIYIMALKSGSRGCIILLAVMLIATSIFHPITAFIFGLIIFLVSISRIFVHRYNKNLHLDISLKNRVNLFAILLLGIWYFFWLLQFGYFGATVKNMYDSILEAEVQYAVIGQAIENASAVGNNPIIEIIKRYGKQIVVISLSSAGLVSLLYHDRLSKHYRTLRLFVIPFLGIVAFMIAMVAAQGFTMATRYLNYIMIIGVLFCAYLIVNLFNHMTKKPNFSSIAAVIVVIGIICMVLTHGFVDVYPSPYNVKASYHTTQMSISGMGWFFEHRIMDTPLIGITVAPGRYADLLLPPAGRKEQNLPNYMFMEHKGGKIDDRRPPAHFGYRNSLSLGDYYDLETDFITNRQDIEYYSVTRPELGALYWQNEDFQRLSNDPKLSKVYWNGEYTMWKVRP